MQADEAAAAAAGPIGIEYVPFAEDDSGHKAADALRRNGVVVITGVFDESQVAAWKEGIISKFCTLFPWLSANDPTTWTTPNLPPQVRTGLYQGLVCNLPEVWAIRTHERVRRVFEGVYSDLRGRPVTQLFTSVDGINLRPPHAKTVHSENSKDWAHVDQTTQLENPFACVQGQVVLSSSTAGFVCSPGSHLLHRRLLEAAKSPLDSGNWHKFEHADYGRLQAMVEAQGGQWQVNIPAPAGAMILWLSSTVHSAKIQDKGDASWRCVVYVCQRPKSECAKTHDKRLRQCIAKNRVTNHWGTRLFARGSRYPLDERTPEELRGMVEDPAKVLAVFPVADTPAVRRLTMLKEEDAADGADGADGADDDDDEEEDD